MARETQADVWRKKAEEALRQVSRALDFFLFATSQLVSLTNIHTPDDYSHCTCCKQPWPCETMQVVQRIGARFQIYQEDTSNDR
jgi:hypothetical protein